MSPSFIFAQPPANTCTPPSTACLNTPYNGNIDLANPTTLHSIVATPQRLSYARTTLNSNFHDVKYVNDPGYDTVMCLPPDSNQCDNDTSILKYDVYYPTDHNYTACPLPAIILFHAGGFLECSNLLLPNIVTVAQELSRRGYVVYSVEYRTGILKAPGTRYTSVQQQLAVYRACQDARGAIRSIILRQLLEGTGGINDPYRINPDKIFVGGFSAGGLIAMNASWYTPSMVYSIFPNSGTVNIQTALGFIDADYSYASKATLIAKQGHDYQKNIIGNACMWGAIGIPVSYDNHEYDFFQDTLLKLLISFQRRQDATFPYPDNDVDDSSQNVYFSTSSGYNSTSYCINASAYTLDGNKTSSDLITGSTLNMRKILLQDSIANEHYVDCDMYHGFSTDSLGFHGDFGTGVTNEQDACVYLAKRIATYFQAVLNGNEKNLGTDYFPDCKNGRTKCNAKTTSCPLTDCEVH